MRLGWGRGGTRMHPIPAPPPFSPKPIRERALGPRPICAGALYSAGEFPRLHLPTAPNPLPNRSRAAVLAGHAYRREFIGEGDTCMVS